MPDDKREDADQNFVRGEAAHTVMSLSQALLAPLDALLKAQVHSARSFLNFILQIGYPHRLATGAAEGGAGAGAAGPRGAGGGANPAEPDDGRPYRLDFSHDVPGGGRQTISIPTLALVPVAPLGVSGADFSFDFYVKEIARHRQIQASEEAQTDAESERSKGAAQPTDRFTRPWFLVDRPLSLQGTFAPGPQGGGDAASRIDEARFHIDVKVTTMPVPPALEKLLAGLTQVTTVEDERPPTRDQPRA
jgi:hypothetical protein